MRHLGLSDSPLGRGLLTGRFTSVVSIPGTRKISRLEENAGAEAVELTPADLAKLDAVLPKGAASGERYTAQGMQNVNR